MTSCVSAVDFGTSKYAGAAAGVDRCGSVGAILGGLLPGYLPITTLFYGFAAALLAMLLLASHWNRMPAADSALTRRRRRG